MKNYVKMFFLVLLVFFLLYPLISRAQFFLMDNPLLGNAAPDFSLENLKGERKNLTELREGQHAIIFFWTTWCPHCREQLSKLHQDKEKIEKNNIKLILVNLGESVSQVSGYFRKHGFVFDVLFDASGKVASDYEVVGVPTYIFINQEGLVKAVENVLIDHYEDVLNKI